MIIKPLPRQPSEWEEVDKEEEMVDEVNDSLMKIVMLMNALIRAVVS